MYFGTNIRKDFRLKKFFRNLFSFYFLVSQHANLHLLICEHWFGIRVGIYRLRKIKTSARHFELFNADCLHCIKYLECNGSTLTEYFIGLSSYRRYRNTCLAQKKAYSSFVYAALSFKFFRVCLS